MKTDSSVCKCYSKRCTYTLNQSKTLRDKNVFNQQRLTNKHSTTKKNEDIIELFHPVDKILTNLDSRATTLFLVRRSTFEKFQQW